MFFPDDAVRVAALSEYVDRWVAAETYAHAQRRRTVPSCSDDVKKVFHMGADIIGQKTLWKHSS